jgi:hypothetical protein
MQSELTVSRAFGDFPFLRRDSLSINGVAPKLQRATKSVGSLHSEKDIVMKSVSRLMATVLFVLLSPSARGGEMKILTNHIGYEAMDSKHAFVLGRKGDKVQSFKIVNYPTGEEAFAGIVRRAGPVQKSPPMPPTK